MGRANRIPKEGESGVKEESRVAHRLRRTGWGFKSRIELMRTSLHRNGHVFVSNRGATQFAQNERRVHEERTLSSHDFYTIHHVYEHGVVCHLHVGQRKHQYFVV